MPRYKCKIEYDGTGLAGWQRQDDAPSVQQYIEESIYKYCQETVRVHTSGRTDAGVHAMGQVIHFDLARECDPEQVRAALNQHIKPHLIAIVTVEIVSEEFHARFSATKRYYLYKIINRRSPPALERGRAWFVPQKLDVEKMRKGAEYLIGKHDFTSFRASGCQAKSPIKTVDSIRIEQNGEMIEVYVEAKSFLHHMVRNIVGTLKYVGEGRFKPEDVKIILEACDRSKAGPRAAACGLYFVRVDHS